MRKKSRRVPKKSGKKRDRGPYQLVVETPRSRISFGEFASPSALALASAIQAAPSVMIEIDRWFGPLGSFRASFVADPERLEMTQNATTKREKAAQLIAEDCLSDEKIAAEVGIGQRTLARWKATRPFMARVEAIAAAFTDHALARKERRISVLNDLHEKMLQVIAERAQSPDLAAVPGGKTGLVTKMLKGIGKGHDFQVVEVYELDTGTVKEIRAIQEQVAGELGQRVERRETVDLNKLFDRMTPDELDGYARNGTLPKWFPARAQQQEVRQNA